MSTRLRVLLAALLLVAGAGCKANKLQSCNDHFEAGEKPAILSQGLAAKTTLLCFEGYVVTYSGVSRTPIWSAEHLTAQRIEEAKGMKRKNAFHPEEQLPPGERSELADYSHSGFDRGHMSPSGDMPTEQAQYESFSLANMVPQSPKNNQILWEGIEEATRNLTRQDGEVYVVTGPIFEGASLQRINGRVLVPTAIFKAIYDPARHGAAAYVTPNQPGMKYQVLSIADLEKRTHIDPFPKLPASIKETKMTLPIPTPHGHRKHGGPVEVE